MAAAPVGISNSQTERIGVFVYFQTDDQYHEPNVIEALHRWNVGDLQSTPYVNFSDFITRFKTALSERGITDYLLNYGPLFDGTHSFLIEKYGDAVPDTYKNKLFSVNLSHAEAEAIGVLQLGFVLWSNVVHPPIEEITYNPLEVNPQDGVHVQENPEIFFQGAPVNDNLGGPILPPVAAAGVGGPPNNQVNLLGGRRRRTHKRRRSVRKRASRRS